MQFWKVFHTLVIAVTLCVTAVSAYAQPDVRPGCDPEVMDAIEAKGWLHAQRRVAQNKNLIFKPDSVLEYSCFNRLLEYFAYNEEGRRFSENYPEYPLWDMPITDVDDTSLDRALNEVIMEPLIDYLDINFDHTYLGGRMVAEAGGTPTEYGEYNCDAMQYVWHVARCMNFVEDNQTPERGEEYVLGDDDFYDFPWYISNDPRRIPEVYPACTPPDIVSAAITESYRGFDPNAPGSTHGDEHPTFTLTEENNPYLDDGEVYEEDPMVVQDILDKALPGNCALSAVVPTGVWIEIPGHINFAEHVCSIPACSFDGENCVN